MCLRGADGIPAAALLASPDGLGTAWVHWMAAAIPPGIRSAWEALWPEVVRILADARVPRLWAMTVHGWLIERLKESGFFESSRVIVYSRPSAMDLAEDDITGVQPLRAADLPEVETLDHAAFPPPWQMDADALSVTRERSAFAVVHRAETGMTGYLMASPIPGGLHITRIAVHPDFQRRGIGRALAVRAVRFAGRSRLPRVTVNTQIDNRHSRRLYASLGFLETGEAYPVFNVEIWGRPSVLDNSR